MWSEPYWAKPFGALSERREQKAVIGTEWENLSVPLPKPLRKNIDLFSVFKRTASGALKSAAPWSNCRQAVVKLKKYAHERMVLSSYLKAPEYRGKKITIGDIRRQMSLSGKLDIRRESRQGLVIGGRLREKPSATRFTTTGKNMVRDGAYISEHETRGNGCFLTLTFPGGTDAGYEVMAFASGYCVDRVNRFLRYRVHKGVFSYVWELQQRGAPHLHYIFRLPGDTVQDAFLAEVKALWYRVLCDVTEDTQTDLFEREEGGTWLDKPEVLQVDIRPVRETYSKYLSKYLSKTRSKGGKNTSWCPGRWWGVSAPARKLIMAARLETVFPVASAPGTFQYMKDWISSVKDLVQDAKEFARIPNGENDGISLEPLVGCGTLIYRALENALIWGDYGNTFELMSLARDACFMGPHVWRIDYHDCS